MFIRAVIELSSPICGCPTQDLTWGIHVEGQKAGLNVTCNKCQTRLMVPPGEFRASIRLEKPYPGVQPPAAKPDATVLHLLPPETTMKKEEPQK